MFKKLLMAIIMLALMVTGAYGQAGDATCTERSTSNGKNQGQLFLECTADSSDGSLSYTTTNSVAGLIYSGMVIPGTTGFTTAATDLTVTHAIVASWSGGSGASYSSGDIFGGAFADMVNTAATVARPIINGNDTGFPINSTLTLTLAQNTVNSARFLVLIYYYK